MNVAHISTAKTWRGGEQQIAYLYKELQSHGVNQVIVCVEGSELERYAALQRWNCATALSSGSLSLSFYRQIAAACYLQNIDIIHIHDSHAHNNALLAHYFSKVKQPMVLSRRVDFPVGTNFVSRWKYNHPNIKRILCVSNAIREIVAETIDDNGRLEVVHDGIDLLNVPKASDKLRKEFGIPMETSLIGNVAALAPHKDHMTFLRTVKKLQGMNMVAHYFLIGEGGERKKIENAVREMGLEKSVTLTGFRKDAKELLAELDVLLVTSETEGLGSTILDAFACETPVVATAAGGIPELVVHDETGLLAPVKDYDMLAANVFRMLYGKGVADRLVLNAKEKVKDFSTTVMGERTLAIYKDILDKQ